MNHTELTTGLKVLRLHEISKEYPQISKLAEKEKKTYDEYLEKLVQIEIEAKQKLKVEKMKKQAKMPLTKSIIAYDFTLREGITEQQIKRLSTGDFLKNAGNIVFYGGVGLGKTHLALALTNDLCELGYKCLFSTAHNLINQLLSAKKDLTLTSLFKRLDQFDLIACDEIGFVAHEKDGADLFFQLISQRSERKSMIFTTNLTFSEWEQVFLDSRTTAAAVDRVIANCETFNIKGESYREIMAKKKMKQISLTNVSK